MNKEYILQSILNKTHGKSYLEIGVATGYSFFSIDAKIKIGVDPVIPKKVRLKQIKRIGNNFLSGSTERLYKKTSDVFFKKNSNRGMTFDVIFIDGLHTYAQSLKDVLNSLQYLNEGGIIVMHDCNPVSESMGYSADSYSDYCSKKKEAWTSEWCGDVWKTIVYLRSTRQDLNIVVIDCDYGVGIIRKGSPESMLAYDETQIDRLTYSDLTSRRKEFLNLKGVEHFEKYLSELQ